MFIAIRDIRFAKGRFALLGGVIALMTLMVVLLTGLTAGLGAASVSALTALPADRLALQPPGAGDDPSFGTSGLPPETVAAIAAEPGVTAAYGLGVATVRLGTGAASSAAAVLGTDPALFPSVTDGTAPGDGGLAVSADLAEDLGLAPGDTVTAAGRTLTVAAMVEGRDFNHLPVVYTTLPTWRDLSHTDAITAVAVTGDVDPAALGAATGTIVLDKKKAYDAVGGYASEQGSLTLMRVLLLAVSVLVVGAFFAVWTTQRSTDLAVVRALGGGRAYLLRDALGQALAVLVGGAAVGGALAAVAGAFAAAAVPFVLTASTVGVPVALMVGVGLLGAAACVRRTTTVDPLTALGAAR